MTDKSRLIAYVPPKLQAAIQRDAKAKGQTISAWVERAASAALKAKGAK